MSNTIHQSNPVAIVTGSARRIGREIVIALHAAGFNVVVHYRSSSQKAQELVNRLNQERSDSAILAQADFAFVAEAATVAQKARQHWGRIDVLVNNASAFYPTTVGATSELQWQSLMDSNLKAPYFLVQNLLADLCANQGVVINIADIHGQKPLKGYAVYSIAKAGLVMLTQALAKDLAPDVRVNAILPGVSCWAEGHTWSAAQQQKLIERMPLKRMADPADIARAVLFFIEAKTVTGQLLAVDSGRMLRM